MAPYAPATLRYIAETGSARPAATPIVAHIFGISHFGYPTQRTPCVTVWPSRRFLCFLWAGVQGQQPLRDWAEAGPARPGICPMLGWLRAAFSLFPFLSFLLDNQLIRIGLVAFRVMRFWKSNVQRTLWQWRWPVNTGTHYFGVVDMNPGRVVIHVVRGLATVREGLLFINHNGRAWVRDLILHGGRGNRGVGRMGRTRETASTHRRRGYEGRRNIFRWVVNVGGGTVRLADQSTPIHLAAVGRARLAGLSAGEQLRRAADPPAG